MTGDCWPGASSGRRDVAVKSREHIKEVEQRRRRKLSKLISGGESQTKNDRAFRIEIKG